MSYHVFFAFSSGLTKPIRVPKGTLDRIHKRIAYTEYMLGLKRTPTYTPKGEEQRPGWRWSNPAGDMIEHLGPKPEPLAPTNWSNVYEWEKLKVAFGNTVVDHNHYVRNLYRTFSEKHKNDTESITPEQAQEFWGGLAILRLPTELWTREYYADHMRHIGELLMTGESEGVSLDCKLTPKQADAMLVLIDVELDRFFGFDVRASFSLDSHRRPTGEVRFSDDGGYDWCEHCGPIDADCFFERVLRCSRAKRGKCPLKNEHPAEFEN